MNRHREKNILEVEENIQEVRYATSLQEYENANLKKQKLLLQIRVLEGNIIEQSFILLYYYIT